MGLEGRKLLGPSTGDVRLGPGMALRRIRVIGSHVDSWVSTTLRGSQRCPTTPKLAIFSGLSRSVTGQRRFSPLRAASAGLSGACRVSGVSRGSQPEATHAASRAGIRSSDARRTGSDVTCVSDELARRRRSRPIAAGGRSSGRPCTWCVFRTAAAGR